VTAAAQKNENNRVRETARGFFVTGGRGWAGTSSSTPVQLWQNLPKLTTATRSLGCRKLETDFRTQIGSRNTPGYGN